MLGSPQKAAWRPTLFWTTPPKRSKRGRVIWPHKGRPKGAFGHTRYLRDDVAEDYLRNQLLADRNRKLEKELRRDARARALAKP